MVKLLRAAILSSIFLYSVFFGFLTTKFFAFSAVLLAYSSLFGQFQNSLVNIITSSFVPKSSGYFLIAFIGSYLT